MTDEMRAFLDYLCGKGANSGLTKDIEAGVAHVKAYKPWEAEYMQLHEMISLAEQDARKIGYNEGHAEGESAAKMDAVDRLAAEGTFTVEKACEVLGVPLKDYEEHRRAMQ